MIDDSNRFNLWFAFSAEFQAELVGVVRDGVPAIEFNGLNHLDAETLDLFRSAYDAAALDRIFKRYDAPNGKQYRLWSMYNNAPSDTGVVRSDLDQLESTHPADFTIMGGWYYLSDMPKPEPGVEPRARPIGMNWSGNPSRPVGNQFWATPEKILNFMPDVMVDPGDPDAVPPIPPTYEPATKPVDGNLLYGQSPRYFVLG